MAFQSMTTLPPARAPVTPRGAPATGGETLPLETYVRSLYRTRPIIAIVGPSGSGKSTAVAHLGHALSDLPITFLDEPADVYVALLSGGAVVATFDVLPTLITFDVVLNLAPWGESERIDYLLARHPAQVRSVMERLAGCDCVDALEGSPRLWTLVLDYLATHPSQTDVSALLHRTLETALGMFGADADQTREVLAAAARSRLTVPAALPALLRHSFMQRLALVDVMLRSINGSDPVAGKWWDRVPEATVLDTLGSRLRADPARAFGLAARVARGEQRIQPAAVSALLAASPEYRPPPSAGFLAGVVARQAKWRRVELSKANFVHADLTGADLSLAELRALRADHANLCGANLSAADLANATFRNAELREASLARAVIGHADFTACSATAAIFDAADMFGAIFTDADLRGASFVGANLARAHLAGARMEAADLTSALLRGATLIGLDLRDAVLDGIQADAARFSRANLEGTKVHHLRAEAAHFVATDCTGSSWPGAQLRSATFRQAGLADIDWPGADLRDADFTHAAFHMGSSRSGMLDSPVACEGSRTGFYTDDYAEQDFRPPEEIRKANLCDADLRGANVTGTDWYLVDLRRAKYTRDQAVWFRKCGAILQDRQR